MKTKTIRILAGMIAVGALALGQQAKSQKELEAVKAVIGAQTPDARIAAVNDLITNFADTEFKAWALTLAADASEKKGDAVKAMVYAQSALEADPKNYQAMLLLSGELARTTRENDLDREEKLTRAEKLVSDAIAAINAAPKPNPQITDDQWAAAKKDFISQAHENMGLAALARKKNDVAITEFKTAVEGASTPDPTTMVRLASAYDQAGKYDEGLAILAKVLAMPDVNPVVKQFAQSEKTRAEQAKNSKK